MSNNVMNTHGLDYGKTSRYDPIVILIPVFNDWEALKRLLHYIDHTLVNLSPDHKRVDIIIVDDASVSEFTDNINSEELGYIYNIYLLELRRNMGHQRAIALGLAYVEENLPCQAVLIMDGDGEDDPKDIASLIEKYQQEEHKKIIFAHRRKRSEQQSFKFFYGIYKLLYRILTGQRIQFGNFSIVPRKILSRLVVVSEIWNHYASGVLKSRIPYAEIYTTRGHRLAGKPQMNLVSLVTHGLSSISVYAEVVGTRLLISTSAITLFSMIAIAIIVFMRLATNLAIPGWASSMVGIFFIIIMQAVVFSLILSILVLSNRNNFNFLPNRDYKYFVLKCSTLVSKKK
ncbi:glycosyltransferase [Roseofilum capinflatum]|uniref:Glycosyltransferase n=1 Tax=Roseofilum capinflatum BLCC-M114 TaxID=3022440 RepID=A0ABT7B889_9CYAN|nr:glycosyltransferase [Roseofilum capinflatum]MDJ1175392.1 glycosyltransferase [Roseofilum capinflatum BLCC-M114]